ncbi:MAG: NAD(P)-binding domain-containing protein, partial [Burkholderiaceae bacterium]
MQPALTLIGLGKMGGNMARRLARHGFTVHGYDPSPEARQAIADLDNVVVHTDLAAAVNAQP